MALARTYLMHGREYNQNTPGVFYVDVASLLAHKLPTPCIPSACAKLLRAFNPTVLTCDGLSTKAHCTH